jgi:hypothetical protein
VGADVIGRSTRNSIISIGFVVLVACDRRTSTVADRAEARADDARGAVQHCRVEAARCHDYAGSPEASTVCEQEFRSCLATLVQTAAEAGPAEAVEDPVASHGHCIDDIRACLVAMSAPLACASRASDCLESFHAQR